MKENWDKAQTVRFYLLGRYFVIGRQLSILCSLDVLFGSEEASKL